MREIIVRNLTSSDWLKRDCVVSELMQQGDYATHVIRRCTYRVESQTPLSAILRREQHAQVRLGLGRLRRMDRETLVAFYFDGHSLLEMSNQFHTPVGTIKRRLHVARKRLARELEAMAPA